LAAFCIFGESKMKFKAFLIILSSTALIACGGGNTSTVASDACAELDGFDCEAMLQDITNVTKAKAAELTTVLTELSSDVDLYCANTSGATELDNAQAAFKNTMAIVQQLEVMQFGPIAEVRDDFYVWPTNSLCRIDDQVATSPTADISNIDGNSRSLTAVEYLLFNEDVILQCQSALGVEAWMASTPDLSDRKDARCAYAKNIVDDLELKAASLETALSDYDLTTAFGTLQLAANAISDGLFYVDTQTKDAKIKEPLILNSTSSSDVEFNVAQLESQFAAVSKEHINNNLIAAKAIIEAGIDDYLIAKGQQGLVTNMLDALDGALENVAAIDGSLNAALTTQDIDASACTNLGSSGTYDEASEDLEVLCALQWNIKTFTDLLKQDFVLALSFSTPATADGDND
jgi:predicted lipoprotein